MKTDLANSIKGILWIMFFCYVCLFWFGAISLLLHIISVILD